MTKQVPQHLEVFPRLTMLCRKLVHTGNMVQALTIQKTFSQSPLQWGSFTYSTIRGQSHTLYSAEGALDVSLSHPNQTLTSVKIEICDYDTTIKHTN